ncbi:hypothetical protein [Microtetraspora malaysiensis]|uniref:hypothetical protein n=1 Tax=Microtetraspora malaysiensis TaxID=161358 RepID=UPI0012FB7EBE|nr:hypothetical protein [Microtetraspora malaysiensis]
MRSAPRLPRLTRRPGTLCAPGPHHLVPGGDHAEHGTPPSDPGRTGQARTVIEEDPSGERHGARSGCARHALPLVAVKPLPAVPDAGRGNLPSPAM